jgi:2-polyprenyl-3-methyl-5-hydroxy-6-metoxy-1,4-benzoquinol methylase
LRGDHPTENSFNRLAHEQLDGVLQAAASEHARGRLVDIGCGLKPYARMFAPFVEEHVGVDHPESPHALTSVDVLATAYDIPLEAETFDTVLMTEVLEHLETPDAALAEAERLLRRGGKIILTTPFIWVLHEEPRDFFRYTPHGLRYLLENASTRPSSSPG